jgi:hypothetical protein
VMLHAEAAQRKRSTAKKATCSTTRTPLHTLTCYFMAHAGARSSLRVLAFITNGFMIELGIGSFKLAFEADKGKAPVSDTTSE